jgi:hypothetical protein
LATRASTSFEAVRFGPLPRLSAELLAPRLSRGDAGADALLRQLALELGDAREHGRHHPPVRRREVERHAVQRDERDPLRMAHRAPRWKAFSERWRVTAI